MPITIFRGPYWFLSNFYPCVIQYANYNWLSVEHAYQAAKTENISEKEQILNAFTAKEAKRLGKTVQIRDDWDNIKIDVMYDLLNIKFFPNPTDNNLTQALLNTGEEEIIHENVWKDTFWGVCNGVGENHLGKLLMEIRYKLRKLDNYERPL